MKTILITGGSRGIGLAIAEKYLKTEEYNVVVTGRKEQTLEELSKEVDNKNFHTIAAKADDEEAADNTCKDVNEKFGSLDILVNNAGTTTVGSIDGTTSDEWDLVINTNLRGPWFLAKEWVSSRRKKNIKGGNVLNISSICGEAAQKGNGVYCVSKAGLSHLTRQMALEWAKYSIRVNALAPGYMRSDINKDFIDSDMSNDMINRIPMRRVGDFSEMDGPLLLLVSDAGSYITGETIIADGGHLLREI